MSYVQTPVTADSKIFSASPFSACNWRPRTAAQPLAKTAMVREAKWDPSCDYNDKWESEEETDLFIYFCTYLWTHTLEFIASKAISDNLVRPSYIYLSGTCVTEINYWQRDRVWTARKHSPTAVCSMAHAVCSPQSMIVPRASCDMLCVRIQVAVGKAYVYLAIPTAPAPWHGAWLFLLWVIHNKINHTTQGSKYN